MTRILLLGDTAGTGFGTVTRDLASAMVKRGDDVRIVSMNEDAGAQTDPGMPANLRERIVILGHDDGWLALGAMTEEGQDQRLALLARARGIFDGSTLGWKPDAALIVGDVASLKLSPWPAMLPPELPAFNYVPVEGIDLPPRWRHIWDRIRPVAMSEFGADQIHAMMGGDRPPVVYHGVDPDAFWPVSQARPLVLRLGRNKVVKLTSRAECRQFLGWPLTATILFRADRHMPRKNYASLLRCVAPVLAKHPEAWLIWHCRTIDQGGDLMDESSKYPDAIAARMASTGFHDTVGGVDRKVLCAMYNAADLYVSTSAEGFGLTIAESIACGVPAVGLRYSSVPEVIGPAGVTVPVLLQDNPYSYFWAMPREAEYSAVLGRLVVDRSERQRLGALGPGHMTRFSWEAAAEQFGAIVAGAEAPAPPPVPLDRRLAALGLVGGRQT